MGVGRELDFSRLHVPFAAGLQESGRGGGLDERAVSQCIVDVAIIVREVHTVQFQLDKWFVSGILEQAVQLIAENAELAVIRHVQFPLLRIPCHCSEDGYFFGTLSGISETA